MQQPCWGAGPRMSRGMEGSETKQELPPPLQSGRGPSLVFVAKDPGPREHVRVAAPHEIFGIQVCREMAPSKAHKTLLMGMTLLGVK